MMQKRSQTRKRREFMTRGVLYVITCASASAPRIPHFVVQAQTAGWDVCVILTPHATKFVDGAALAHLTGHPVRSEYKRPEEPDVLPRADAVVALPVTFNTLNKWALGISDTLAVGLLCEYTGRETPIIAVPGVTTASGLDTHPAFLRSMRMLKRYGVHVLYEPEVYPPRNEVPDEVILERLHRLIEERSAGG
jgi:phosphopantothenoylcysteine synthetase/decarboxylase